MNWLCDLCESTELEEVYTPLGRLGDERVVVCHACSLVQTLPRPRRATAKIPRLSCGADFGNLRYHKGLMHERAIGFLEKNLDFGHVRSILEIGANRGHLAAALRRLLPQGRMVAVEPDERVVTWRDDLPGVELLINRFEDVQLGGARFDLISCFHTLEHVDNPRSFIAKMRSHLEPGGVIFLEVPDLAVISDPAIVEEFFIDKHLFHFSRPVLGAYLSVAGLDALCWSEGSDSSLGVIARAAPAVRPAEAVAELREEALHIIAMIDEYEKRIERNFQALASIGEFISCNQGRRILLWGAGRIFNAFAQLAAPLSGTVVGLVDKYVADETVAGLPVLRPEQARKLAPDCVIIFSRDYFDDIKREAHAVLGKGATILSYDQLMAPGEARPAV